MAEPVRARRLTDQEGRRLQQIVRRGKHGSIRVRRAVIIMASASGTPVPAIARLVAADEDTVRDVIHLFNAKGLAALDPRWAGGRPRRIGDDDVEVIVMAASTRPEKLGLPFTHWSLRKLAAYLASHPGRPVRAGRERLRQILHARGITFQRTRTWKESTDPDRDAKLDRIEYVTSHFAARCFAFDQFGPLSIRPCRGVSWARKKRPARLPATCHRTHGIRYFHGCYCFGNDQLWGVLRERKGADHTLAALKSIRAASPAATACSSSWATCRPARPRPSGAGPGAPTSSCASRPPTHPGPTRSSRNSGPCAPLSSADPTTAATRCWPAACTITCAGATPTPATPTSWPPSDANAPGSQRTPAPLGPPEGGSRIVNAGPGLPRPRNPRGLPWGGKP
jgi:transposase